MGRQAEASGPTQLLQSNNRCLSCFAEGSGGGGGGWWVVGGGGGGESLNVGRWGPVDEWL